MRVLSKVSVYEITKLPIVKQALFLEEEKARVGIYKLAEALKLKFLDHVSSLEDLQLVFNTLP